MNESAGVPPAPTSAWDVIVFFGVAVALALLWPEYLLVWSSAIPCVIILRRRGLLGVRDLWLGTVGYRTPAPGWALLVAVVSMPAVTAASAALMALTGSPLPAIAAFVWWPLPFVVAATIVEAIPEEVGWTTFATDPLVRRFGPLRAGLAIGTAWALWHIRLWWPGLDGDFRGMAGMVLIAIAVRILMTWLYVTGGRNAFLCVVMHAMANTSMAFMTKAGAPVDSLMLGCVLVVSVVAGLASSPRLRGSPGRMHANERTIDPDA